MDITGIEQILLSMHGMAAVAFKSPVFAIDEAEAKTVAKAIVNVQRFYPMKASAEAMAWVNLVMVLLAVYGTRIAAYRMSQKTAQTPANTPSNVQPIFRG